MNRSMPFTGQMMEDFGPQETEQIYRSFQRFDDYIQSFNQHFSQEDML